MFWFGSSPTSCLHASDPQLCPAMFAINYEVWSLKRREQQFFFRSVVSKIIERLVLCFLVSKLESLTRNSKLATRNPKFSTRVLILEVFEEFRGSSRVVWVSSDCQFTFDRYCTLVHVLQSSKYSKCKFVNPWRTYCSLIMTRLVSR